jgi:hypothetical protein
MSRVNTDVTSKFFPEVASTYLTPALGAWGLLIIIRVLLQRHAIDQNLDLHPWQIIEDGHR